MLTEEHEKPIQVTYKFLLPDHDKELKMFQSGQDFLMAIWDIKMICRQHYKNGIFETLDEFCEAILEVVNNLPIEEMYE